MNDEKEKQLDIETIPLTEIVEGSSVFESTGTSYLKVTYKGEIRKLAIPIKSKGVSEIIEEFSKDAPTPPTKEVVIESDSEIGKMLRFTKKKPVRMFDLSNSEYLKEKEKHDTTLGFKVAFQGIDLIIRDRDGNIVEDEDKKLNILRAMGMTGSQFLQLVKDIQDLTRWQEDREDDFLAG